MIRLIIDGFRFRFRLLDLVLNLPVVQQANVPQIKKIPDTRLECLNSIRNLGVNIDGWDPFIVRILFLKLDADTHDHYLESLKECGIYQESIAGPSSAGKEKGRALERALRA